MKKKEYFFLNLFPPHTLQKLRELCPHIGQEKRAMEDSDEGSESGDAEVEEHLIALAETVEQLENLATSITTLFTPAQRARGCALGRRLTDLFSSWSCTGVHPPTRIIGPLFPCSFKAFTASVCNFTRKKNEETIRSTYQAIYFVYGLLLGLLQPP